MNCTSRIRALCSKEEGFALPSVLFLITILSLVILSILTLKYFHQQRALLDIARVKADYAALNAANLAIVELNSQSLPFQHGFETERNYDFGSQGSSVVKIRRWGLYFVMSSTGRMGRLMVDRVALIADNPAKQFENALYFANSQHQLVLTGNTKIKGNVVTGMSGVTIGTIGSLQTPRTLPVEGKINREKIPSISLVKWKQEVDDLNGWLDGSKRISSEPDEILHIQSSVIDSNAISDKIKYVIAEGNVVIRSGITRRTVPLNIIAGGRVELQEGANIRGLVAIFSKNQIVIPSNVIIDAALIFSHKTIAVAENAQISAQLFAPDVQVARNAHLLYPSTVVSFQPKDAKSVKQGVQLANNSVVEGTVALMTNIENEAQTVVNIEPGAKVIGAVVCEGSVTLDGSVYGTVVAKDFYFYEAPTTYLGWIRTGQINRSMLPPSYLSPIGFANSDKLRVLDWL